LIVRIKAGVSLDLTHPKVFVALARATAVWEKIEAREMWITACNEAGHTTNPDRNRQFHRLPDGTCQAFDLRTHNLANLASIYQAQRLLAATLGKYYDVVLENVGTDNEHIHVQYDPERLGTA
jgi:hypothetical protein